MTLYAGTGHMVEVLLCVIIYMCKWFAKMDTSQVTHAFHPLLLQTQGRQDERRRRETKKVKRRQYENRRQKSEEQKGDKMENVSMKF